MLEFGMQGGGVAATLGAWGADPSEISAKSTADPPGNKQTNKSTADPSGKSNADPQTTTIKWNQFKFKE